MPQWDSDVDVAIVGAGGAGLQAAIEAAKADASAIVFEKQTHIWESSTAIAVGRVSFPCTDLQRKNGVEDSKELMYRDIMATGRHKNDPALVQAYVDHALDRCQLSFRNRDRKGTDFWTTCRQERR